MKTKILASALALVLFATGQASAFFEGVIGNLFVVELDNPGTVYPTYAPPTSNPPPNASSGYSVQIGTLSNFYRSPFDDPAGNPTPASAFNRYGVIQAGGFARWDVLPLTIGVSFLWGSPDYFNRVEFFNGSTSVALITGADLTNANRNPPQDPATGQSWVVLSPLVIGSWTSVVFSSSINAFEFTSLQPECFGREGGTGTPPPGPPVCGLIPQTPLPAALPLFVTGLGAFGLLGWRRKKKIRIQKATI